MSHPPAWVEIRGEAFIASASSRSACAGALRQRVSDPVKLGRIRFAAYTLHANQLDTANQIESLNWLENAGFYVNENSTALDTPAAALAYVRQWHGARESLGYPTDGVVIKVASHQRQSEIGETAVAPRWAVAVKAL
jgi:DNA ligase (NAD+)